MRIIIIITTTIISFKRSRKDQKYQDLARERRKIWQVKVKSVPVAVLVHFAPFPSPGENLEEIGTTVRIDLLQKATLLGTARSM